MVDRDLEWYLSRFRSGEPCTLTRWGDGEWSAVFGREDGTNFDGHPFTVDLTGAMQAILRSRPTYVLGMGVMASIDYTGPIHEFLGEHGLEDLEWSWGDVFHDAAQRHDLASTFDALKDRRLLMVGPEHLAPLAERGYLPVHTHIDVGGTKVIEHWPRIVTDVLWYLEAQSESHVVSVCAGMSANCIIHELYKQAGDKHTFIDFGALWDPLVGVKSREYMRRSRDAT